jgi:uncharacterized surface protein with fasciclin (FAS1) repeats
MIGTGCHGWGADDEYEEEGKPDIIDTAVAAENFNTLVTAIQAAYLVGTLKGEGPFTVFAPTDAAFAKLPPGTVENLLKPQNKQRLVSMLTYHVVPGRIMATEVINLRSAKTLNGQALTIKSDVDGVMVDNARVVQTDIGCSNGVMHIIDAVLLPD